MMAQVNAGRVRFVGRGEYNNSTQYYVFDLVSYNGNSYYAKVDTIGNLPTNTTYWQLVAEKGNVGPTGLTGNGISSIEKTSTSGLVDTYTITFTNGNTTTFDVSNGNGIDRIEKTATVGNIDTYTIYFNDNSTSTFEVANGEVTKEELEEEVDRLSMIYNLFPTTSDEDTEMTLDGTGEVKLKKIGLKGNTYQESTTGKNKYGITSATPQAYSNSLPVSSTNYIKIDSYDLNNVSFHSTGNQYYQVLLPTIQLEPNTDYILSYTRTNNLVTGASARRWYYTINNNNEYELGHAYNAGDSGDKTYQFTTGTTGKIAFAFGYSNQSSGSSSTVNNIMIRLATESDTYEPYTYGASPNPDYPQDIKVVTGNNSIEVVGKQLFEKEYILEPSSNNKNAHLKAGTYTLATCDGNEFGTHVYFKLFDKNNNTITTSGHLTCSNVQIYFSVSSYNYYGGAGASYMTITIDNDYTIAIGLLDATGDRQVMLVKGSEVVRTYAPYQSQSYPINLGSMELCKIGDYQDYIYKYSGKWYLNKQIGKVVLDGNTTYVKSSGYSDETWFCGYITPNVENFKSGIIAFNNRFQNGMYSVVSDKECMANNRNQLHIRILASRLNENSSSGLSEWFSTHNVEIYYVLETPTTTEITDTTLIEQLDNLENAYSYDTQTNITQTNDDMPFILDVEAIMSLKGVLN